MHGYFVASTEVAHLPRVLPSRAEVLKKCVTTIGSQLIKGTVFALEIAAIIVHERDAQRFGHSMTHEKYIRTIAIVDLHLHGHESAFGELLDQIITLLEQPG